MRRWPAAATIAVLGAAITLVPVAASADEATTTAPAVSTTTETAATPSIPTSIPSTSTVPPATDTTVPAATTSTRPAPHRTAAAASTDHVIKVTTGCTYYCYAPATMSIAVGDTVTWSNTSGAPHPMKRCAPAACDGASGGTGTDTSFGAAVIELPAGKTAQFTFSQPGTYVYYCTIHGYAVMHGTITVAAAATTTTAPPNVAVEPLPTTTTTTPSAGPHLASTGSDTDGVVIAALVMLALGLAAVGATNRRRTDRGDRAH